MQTLIKVFEILLGTTQTIRYSHIASRNASFPVALLIVVYLTILNETDWLGPTVPGTPFDSVFDFGALIFCFFIALVLLGGLAIGWLFTRPLASFLEVVLPDMNSQMVWGFSNGLIWTILAAFISYPEDFKRGLLIWASFLIVILVAFGFGFLGGWQARREAVKLKREILISGAIATGSLIGLMQTALEIYSSGGLLSYQISNISLQLISSMAIWSFVCMIPYAFIGLIAIILSVVKRLNKYYLLIIVLISTLCWLLIGGAFLGLNPDTLPNNVIMPTIIFGFFGACGGFVIGQLKPDIKPNRKEDVSIV